MRRAGSQAKPSAAPRRAAPRGQQRWQQRWPEAPQGPLASPPAQVEAFIFDCDGVIWRGESLIDGIPETLDMLRAAGKRLIFVTNNSTKSRKGYQGKFTGLGLSVPPEEIYSSSFAAAAYLEATRFPKDKKVYIVGEVGVQEELDLLGFQHLGGPEDKDKACRVARACVQRRRRWRTLLASAHASAVTDGGNSGAAFEAWTLWPRIARSTERVVQLRVTAVTPYERRAAPRHRPISPPPLAAFQRVRTPLGRPCRCRRWARAT